MAFLDGWGARAPITIQSSQVTGTHSDFPVYMDLAQMPSSFWSKVQSDGGDVRVTTSDGETLVPHEVSFIDTGNQQGALWLKPAADVTDQSDLDLFVYYDNSDASALPVTDPNGRNAVWSNGYLAVSHLEESSGNAIDATGNGNDANVNGATQGSSGKIGDAYEFDGSDDFLKGVQNLGISGDAELTMCAWIKWNGNSWNSDFPSFMGNNTTRASDEGLSFTVKEGRPAIDFWSNRWRADNALNVKQWYHVCGTKTPGMVDAQNSAVYVDGNEVAASAESSDTPNISDSPLIVGRLEDDSSRYFDGLIDEVRYLDRAVSSDWVATEHANQNDPASFISVGSEETLVTETASGSVVSWSLQPLGSSASSTSTAPATVQTFSLASLNAGVRSESTSVASVQSMVATVLSATTQTERLANLQPESVSVTPLTGLGSGMRTAPADIAHAVLDTLAGTGSGTRTAPADPAQAAWEVLTGTGSGVRTAPTPVTPITVTAVTADGLVHQFAAATVAQLRFAVLEAGRIVGRRVSRTGGNDAILAQAGATDVVLIEHGPTNVATTQRGRTNVEIPDVGETEVQIQDAP